MSNGRQLQLWECNGSYQQTWAYDSDGWKVYIAGSATCFDLYEDQQYNGQQLHVWTCNDQGNQQWGLWDAPAPSGGGGGGGNVFPGDHCAYDVGGWPWFATESDLQNDPQWSAYFNAIYGGVPSWGYPICTGAFMFLWHLSVDATGVVQQPPEKSYSIFHQKGKKFNDGTYFSGTSFLEAIDVFAFIYNSNFFGASVPEGYWVEVSHTVFPGDKGAIWYYMAVGSGVWFNVGYTKVYNDHPDAVWDMLGSDCHDEGQDKGGGTPTECEQDFSSLYSVANDLGLDSIQITGHHDCLCGLEGQSSYKYNRLCPTEIIALKDPDGAAKGCSWLLRGGWEASSDCDCQEDFKSKTKSGKRVSYANCGAS